MPRYPALFPHLRGMTGGSGSSRASRSEACPPSSCAWRWSDVRGDWVGMRTPLNTGARTSSASSARSGVSSLTRAFFPRSPPLPPSFLFLVSLFVSPEGSPPDIRQLVQRRTTTRSDCIFSFAMFPLIYADFICKIRPIWQNT